MSDSVHNLFNALFDFRPRDNHTAKENFLSEGFAYVLKTSEPALDAWLSMLLNRSVKSVSAEICTRDTERLDGKPVFPDMRIKVELADGQSETIYSEHKWDADCLEEQLQSYYQVAKQSGANARLVFIGRTLKQRNVASATKLQPEGKPLDGCYLWEDVFTVLDAVADKDKIFSQFMVFMKTQGLSPGEPLSPVGLISLVEEPKARLGIKRAIDRLSEMDWSVVPSRYRGNPKTSHSQWGCAHLVFATKDWRPTVTLGFLLDTYAHRVSFTCPTKGIDLVLRIAAPPAALQPEKIRPVLAVLQGKLPQLKASAGSALLVGDAGNGNQWSLLIVQKCLADVIVGAQAETESAQHDEVHRVLNEWLQILFGDGTLESALLASGLNGADQLQSLTSSPPACANPTPAPAGE